MLTQIYNAALITLGFFLFSGSVVAGDSSAGKLKSAACSACHGPDGNSQNPQIPILAGQDSEYIVGQLRAFKYGRRDHEAMKGVTQGLSENDMLGLAAFFAGQGLINRAGSTQLAEKGKAKYSACWGCHGQYGEGAEGYPRLAGQHPRYTVQQLENFKRGLRENPAMKAMVGNLSESDMVALGDYLGSLKSNYVQGGW